MLDLRWLAAVSTLLAVLGCAGWPGDEAPILRAPASAAAASGAHAVVVNADGTFSPANLTIRAGETVEWQLASAADGITRTLPPSVAGACGKPAPWTGTRADLAGPAGLAPGGVFALAPFSNEPGFEATSADQCAGGPLVAQAGGSGLCATGALGATMPETWADPALAGVHIRLLWNQIQPAKNRFAFEGLARELDQAVAHGKRFSLSIKAGRDGTPDWIFGAGVERLSFRDGGTHTEGCGSRMDLGSPADPAYAALYARMLEELAAFVRSRSDWYRALAYIRLGGANLFSAEARLPKECLRECDVCNTEVWARSGYRPSKLYGFYAAQEAQLARLFPDRSMSLQLIQAGFPRVNEQGCWLVGEEDDAPTTVCPSGGSTKGTKSLPKGAEQTEAVIAEGLAAWGPRFQVQHNGLGPAPADGGCPTYRRHPAIGPYKGAAEDCPNRWVLEAGASGAQRFTGFQTNNKKNVATLRELDGALENAWENSDAVYVEIYEERAWEAAHAEAGGKRGASGLTVAEWTARFRERRTAASSPTVADPDAAVFRHTFAGETPGVVHYSNGGRCTEGARRTGTITVLP